jgi:hypothetical protein
MYGIDCLACQDELFVKNPLHVKDFALLFPLGGLLLCLKVITVNSSVVTSDNPGHGGCIVGGDLTKLLAVTRCYF